MSDLKLLKVDSEFILEAVSFTSSKNIETSAHLIKWTIAPESGSPENIGTGKAIRYKVDGKYAGKKVVFRAYIEDGSDKIYPLQSLTCVVEGKASVDGILIKEATGNDSAKVGDAIKCQVTKYNVESSKLTDAQKKCIKWDIKVGDSDKTILKDSGGNPFFGESISITVPKEWDKKAIIIMPYFNKSTESIAVNLNVGVKSTGTCPNCKKDITADDLKKIFWYEKNNKKVYPSDSDLSSAAAIFNKYMVELGLDSCRNKAYFFAVAAVETGYKLQIKGGESFNYYFGALSNIFGAFKTDEGKKKAKEWGRAVKKKEDDPVNYKAVSEENQKKIANYAYSPSCSTGKQLGNTEADDGWDYRGRGIIQLTGRSGYTYANTYTLKEGVDIIKNPNKVGTDLKIGVLASMAFWKWKSISPKANENQGNEICKAVGNDVATTDRKGKSSTNHTVKKQVYKDDSSVAFKVPECQWGKAAATTTSDSTPIETTDIITYHAYFDKKNEVVKQIPKENKHKNKYKFVYHDKNGKVHDICILEGIEVVELAYDKDAGLLSVPAGYKRTYDYPSNVNINGKKSYYYDKGTELDYIVVEPKSDTKSKSYGIKKYKAQNNSSGKNKKTTIVKCDSLNYEKDGVIIKYKFDTTQTARVYSDPGVFAALIGAMAEAGIAYTGCGNTSMDGCGYPSSTHVNGYGLDFSYQGNEKEKKVIAAMMNFGCSRYYVGTNSPYCNLPLNNGVGKTEKHHNDHLHIGPFNKLTVTEQKDK